MLVDSANDKYYVSLIHDYKLMFLVLNYTDGNQLSGTNRHVSNGDCTGKNIYKMYKASRKIYTTAL